MFSASVGEQQLILAAGISLAGQPPHKKAFPARLKIGISSSTTISCSVFRPTRLSGSINHELSWLASLDLFEREHLLLSTTNSLPPPLSMVSKGAQ